MNLSPVPGAPLVLRLLLRGEGKSFSQIAISMRRSCFASDVMRSRHDVMFRFADVVLCFDVVRLEMDVT